MNKILLILILYLLSPVTNLTGQTKGCTDKLAVNYNSSALINDGSCIYNPANIKPVASRTLPGEISETSGLMIWDGFLWTHNDNIDTNIYSLDTVYGSIISALPVSGFENNDWEEISQDEGYIYIGDFGNNVGIRRDLNILRIEKSSLGNKYPSIDKIEFSYSDQDDFDQDGSYKTDFDCEAFIITSDSIFLFTKQWNTRGTSVYSLPKTPGNHVAKLRYSFNTRGLITGAAFLESKRLIVLTGYSKSLDPFLFLLYDYNGTEFFSGNKRRIELLLPSHQVESIATTDGIKYYVTNEHFSLQPLINVRQKIHIFNLSSFLGNHLGFPVPVPNAENKFVISPVPVHDMLMVRTTEAFVPSDYTLLSITGQVLMAGILDSGESMIDMSHLSPGTYFLRIRNDKQLSYKLIKN